MPRIAANGLAGMYGRPPLSAWLSGSSAMAAIARPMPSPMVMISAASQRAIDRTWGGRADEPQEPELAAAPEPDHDQRAEYGD